MNNNLIKQILERELESKNLIFPFVSGLNAREIAVLELRSQNKTLEEIGAKLDLSRERIRQIEQKAGEKIEFQKKIIEILFQKLGEVLFSEIEIEKAFLKFLPSGLPIAEAKLEWNKLLKKLWEFKETKNEF